MLVSTLQVTTVRPLWSTPMRGAKTKVPSWVIVTEAFQLAFTCRRAVLTSRWCSASFVPVQTTWATPAGEIAIRGDLASTPAGDSRDGGAHDPPTLRLVASIDPDDPPERYQAATTSPSESTANCGSASTPAVETISGAPHAPLMGLRASSTIWLPDTPWDQSAKNSPAASALTWGGSVTGAAVESACGADQLPPGDMEFASITEVGPDEVA